MIIPKKGLELWPAGLSHWPFLTMLPSSKTMLHHQATKTKKPEHSTISYIILQQRRTFLWYMRTQMPRSAHVLTKKTGMLRNVSLRVMNDKDQRLSKSIDFSMPSNNLGRLIRTFKIILFSNNQFEYILLSRRFKSKVNKVEKGHTRKVAMTSSCRA